VEGVWADLTTNVNVSINPDLALMPENGTQPHGTSARDCGSHQGRRPR
jgi:hypothetical protein